MLGSALLVVTLSSSVYSHDISCYQVLLAPDLCCGFHFLHTGLGILLNEFIVAGGILCRGRVGWVWVCLNLRGGSLCTAVGLSAIKINVVEVHGGTGVAGALALEGDGPELLSKPDYESSHGGVLSSRV